MTENRTARSWLAAARGSSVLRFGVIGVLNNLLSYAVFAILVLAGVPPLVGATITYAMGMVISYLGNRSFTFRHSGSARRSLIKFLVVNAVGYVVNLAILGVFSERLGWNPLIVQLGAIVVVASITFLSMRFWVFTDESASDETRPGERRTLLSAARSSAVVQVYASVWHRSIWWLRRSSGQSPLLSLPTLLLAAIALWVVGNTLLNPLRESWRYPKLGAILGVAVIVILLPAVVVLCRRIALWTSRWPRAVGGILLVTILAGCFAAQVAIAVATLRAPGFDASVVFEYARNAAAGGEPRADLVEYFRIYPNNLFMTLVYERYFSALLPFIGVGRTAVLTAAVVLNAVLLTASAAATFALVRLLAGTAMALVSLGFSAALIILSPWIGTPYSDTLGMIFPVVIALLAVKSFRASTPLRAGVYLGGASVVGAIGYSVKPTVIFALIAVLLVSMVRRRLTRANLPRIAISVATAVACAAIFAVGVLGIQRTVDSSQLVPFDVAANNEALPFTHFLKMGAQGNGAYLEEDVDASIAVPPDERLRDGLDSYVQRVHAMTAPGYLQFLANKLLFTTDDGTFFQWGEGPAQLGPFIHDDAQSRAVQSFYGENGENRAALVLLWQSTWIALLLLLAVPLFRGGRRVFNDPAAALRLALLALLVFLLLFETRSRYLYLYLPFVISLACLSIHALTRRGGTALRANRPSRRLARVSGDTYD